MLKYFEPVNNRRVVYLDIREDLSDFESVDLNNWAAFVIEDNANNPLLLTFASLCIKKDVLYMCATGKACSIVEDIFDETLVELKVFEQKLPSWMTTEDDVLMTNWHHDFEEGFWYITSVASYNDVLIDTVLVANLTEVDHSQHIEDLITNINKGWLPKH